MHCAGTKLHLPGVQLGHAADVDERINKAHLGGKIELLELRQATGGQPFLCRCQMNSSMSGAVPVHWKQLSTGLPFGTSPTAFLRARPKPSITFSPIGICRSGVGISQASHMNGMP